MRRTVFTTLLCAAVAGGAYAQAVQNGQLQIAPAVVPNSDYLASAGARMSPSMPFYRIGEPFIIPFTPTSGAVEVPVNYPPQTTSFRYVVKAPCAVRLRGRISGSPFVPVTETTGWYWPGGSFDIFTSLQPISVSVIGVDGPFASVQPAQKACSGTVELQPGTGQ
ncbi:hypothetical protein PQI07_22480 [Methylobacterium sp. 092160098-2]|uniref:hypothetical protein n=1 Tax=Methylobacterium sp. 092160098-2 TaxID=3025129 RepID=UPI002381A471|nr:hypothetical protein [Methylobacterium sp. 092160098-2]MDE4913450.1 hypothetical protein [Methylobacterium sp. 092160098-2]